MEHAGQLGWAMLGRPPKRRRHLAISVGDLWQRLRDHAKDVFGMLGRPRNRTHGLRALLENQLTQGAVNPDQRVAPGGVEVLLSAKRVPRGVGDLRPRDPPAPSHDPQSFLPCQAEELGIDVVPVTKADVDGNTLDRLPVGCT